MTLAEGVAAASGVLDAPADPGTVFLYRSEPRELAVKLGVDCSKWTVRRYRSFYAASDDLLLIRGVRQNRRLMGLGKNALLKGRVSFWHFIRPDAKL
jgi:hypothetical protein